MPTEQKFYRTVFEVEVLSEEPIHPAQDFEHTWQECIDGEYSGAAKVVSEEQVDGARMAKLLEEQGSAPSFFQLSETGEDEEAE
jgi:hypothetical protein